MKPACKIIFTLFFVFIGTSLICQEKNQAVNPISLEKGSVDFYKAMLESKLALKAGDLPRASELLTRVVSADPEQIEAWNLLGAVYLQNFNYVLAENAFSNVIDINPGYIPGYQGIAIAQQGLGKYKEALDNYKFFVENFAGSEKDFAIFQTAELLCIAGKYYQALPYYQDLAGRPNSEFSAVSSYYMKNINNNMAKYRDKHKIIKGVPHIVPQENNCMPSALAAVLMYFGEPTGPVELSETLMDTSDGGFLIDMVDYVRKLGYDISLFKGELSDIEKWIDKGIPVIVNQVLEKKGKPDVVHLRTIYGYDLIKQSVYASDIYSIAIKDFMKSWEKSGKIIALILPAEKKSLLNKEIPKDVEYIARADREYVRKNYDLAYKYYIEAEIENDANPRAKLGQIKSLIKMNKIDNAVSQLNELINSNPNLQEAYFLMGIIYFNGNEKDKAFEYLKKCVSIDNKLIPEAHNFLGFLYVEQGKYDEGIEELKHSIELKPDYLNPHYNLAKAYALQGDISKAIYHLKHCIEKGFIGFDDITKDSSFKSLQNYPEFKGLRQKSS